MATEAIDPFVQQQVPAFVQFGCGLSAPDGWRNFDASPTLRLQRFPLVGRVLSRVLPVRWPRNAELGDIVKGLPVPDQSCAAVYASHVLEHLSLQDFRRALENTWRILKPDGVFRLVVPDLRAMAEAYLNAREPTAAHAFIAASLLGAEARPRGVRGLARAMMGNSHHLWMWDYPSLAHELSGAGFRDIRRAAYGDSALPAFAAVEERDRWEGPEGCVGVECRA